MFPDDLIIFVKRPTILRLKFISHIFRIKNRICQKFKIRKLLGMFGFSKLQNLAMLPICLPFASTSKIQNEHLGGIFVFVRFCDVRGRLRRILQRGPPSPPWSTLLPLIFSVFHNFRQIFEELGFF